MISREKVIIEDSVYCTFAFTFIATFTVLTIGVNAINLMHTYQYTPPLMLVFPIKLALFTTSIAMLLFLLDYKKIILRSGQLILIKRFHNQVIFHKEQLLISKKFIFVKITDLKKNKNWYFICCNFQKSIF